MMKKLRGSFHYLAAALSLGVVYGFGSLPVFAAQAAGAAETAEKTTGAAQASTAAETIGGEASTAAETIGAAAAGVADTAAVAGDAGGPPAGIDMERFNGVGNTEVADSLTQDFSSGASTADTFVTLARVIVIVAAVVVAVAAFFLIRAAIKGRKKGKKSKGYNIGASLLAAVMAVAIIAGNWATTNYAAGINNVFSKTSSSSDADITTTQTDWINTATNIAEEGMVLMKNDNNLLPLAKGTKLNLLGYYAYNPFYSGSGSSNVTSSDSVSIVAALQNAGFEINDACAAPYTVTEASDSGIGFDAGSALSIDEVSIDKWIGDASFDNMAAYSDTAVIVLGRTGGEGNDLTSYGEVDGYRYLQLSVNERNLLEQASRTFDHVIVVLNSANAMDMDFVENYGVEALIWAAEPGPYGFTALGEILSGDINPSGKLPDTWVMDNDSAPASENFGDQHATNSDVASYVDYVEGIYVGYKWYETAYEEGAVITNTKNGKTYDYSDYDSIVAYPFGFGLSYTTFDQQITGGTLTDGVTLDPTGSYTLEVTVTNTGDVAGKDAVEIYVTAPYTDYDEENGVEKAAVSLCGIGKTSQLDPGASETVTVEIAMEDIASYDATHDNGDGTQGAYLLDDGDYVFSARSDAHNAYDQVTATVASRYFYSGENQRTSDQQAAYNQFSDAARGIYLSRKDGFANYEEAMNSVSSDVVSDYFDLHPSEYDSSYDTAVTKHYEEGVDYAVNGSLKLTDMTGLDFDDPQWEELIKQLTLDDLKALVVDSTYNSPALASISKSRTSDTDGALGVSNMFHAEYNGISYPCIPLLAATFNKDLARAMGEQVADQCHNFGITGWYSPAMDTHRWAYSGRNFEYYSEDGFLAGAMGAAECLGGRSKGLIVYIKHFALNDQETNRTNHLHTYSNEQAIREIYLKPFEISIKTGEVTGVMNSMNYIGDIYAACHEPLLTEVLRNEWGFRGKVITDMASDASFVAYAQRAGTDGWLSIFELPYEITTDADIYYAQRTAHNILYAEANAVVAEVTTINWHVYFYILYVELAALAVSCIIGIILRNRKAENMQNSPDLLSQVSR